MFSPSDITLYVPYYNAGKTIWCCIESLTNQSITPAELFIVNDGSQQPLPDGIDCKVIFHDGNKGLSTARNTAVKNTKTKLIASVDADVVADEYWLEILLDSLNNNTAVGVGGKMTEFYQENLGDKWRAVHMAQHWGDELIENPRFLFGANTLFEKRIIEEAGGYNELLRTNNEDRTLSDQIYSLGEKMIYEPKAKCSHLRQDKTETILSAYWGWHHAKGLQEGDFDTFEGLISRIARVNFGISNYRYTLDKEEGRNEFLILDLLIPYVFCCKDILLYCQLNEKAVPDLRVLTKLIAGDKSDLLEGFLPNFASNGAIDFWFEKYVQVFEENLKEFMTVDNLESLDFIDWLVENKNRVFEKKR